MRIRFTMRWMMIGVAVVAAALAAWVLIDRERNNPYRHYLAWCRDPTFPSEFSAPDSPQNVRHQEPDCLLKVIDPADPNTGEQPNGMIKVPTYSTFALGMGGDYIQNDHNIVSHFTSTGYLGPVELDHVRKLLAGLPPSDTIPPKGEIVIVTSFDDGRTRVYNKAALPAEVQRLLEALPGMVSKPLPKEFFTRPSPTSQP